MTQPCLSCDQPHHDLEHDLCPWCLLDQADDMLQEALLLEEQREF